MNAAHLEATPVPHFVQGEVLTGSELRYGSGAAAFTTPRLDLSRLVWPRSQPGPAFGVPLDEVIEILVALGRRLERDPDGVLQQALERGARSNPLPRDLLERAYAGLGGMFTRERMLFQIEQELGGRDVLDGWREVRTPSGRICAVRACPTRMLHVIAGNAPGVSASTVMRCALIRGAALIKLPSNDLHTAPAVLRALAQVAPGHPVTRSFSAAYWRGGDEQVESMLFRPQYFDKIVAWGGESTIRGALKYIGPGLELVAFDPKTSISLVGREAFESEAALAEAADRGAADATVFNQQACSSSRFQFVEGSVEQLRRYGELLQQRMNVERPMASTAATRLPAELRDEIEGLSLIEDLYDVYGREGGPIVVRSEEPVGFHPDHRVVNVVGVERLEDAIVHVNVATQTVGIYPENRKKALRDAIVHAGAQRVVSLGGAGAVDHGLPHDGFRPLDRLVRWVNDETLPSGSGH